MASRGFIKSVNGLMRLRWARPGYDANDLSLPQNCIAFDSAASGTMNILGRYTWAATAMSVGESKIISWPTQSYIPWVSISYWQNYVWRGNSIPEEKHTFIVVGSVEGLPCLIARADGIYMRVLNQDITSPTITAISAVAYRRAS